MPVKATFNVDFESFTYEVNKATVSFQRFEGESDKVAAQLSAMADKVTGTKVIAEATLMARAIEQIGGVTKLTDAELVKVGRTAIEAADKFAAFGQEIPKEIQGLIDYADAAVKAAQTNEKLRAEMDQFGVQTIKVGGSVGTLHKSLGEFNSLLSAGGVNVSKEIGALGELGNFAGKTAAQLGTLAVAGGVVGSAMTGWNIGRKIAEFTGSDRIIGDATAKLLGWGDAAGQVAAANADILARATQLVGHSVTDLNDAMAINQQFMEWQIGDATAALLGWGNAAGEVAAANADILARATKNAGYSVTDLSEAMQINAGHMAKEIQHWKDLAAAEEKAAKARADFNAKQKEFDEQTAARLKAIDDAADKAKKSYADFLKQAAFVEQSGRGGTAGLLGLSAEEQKRTQAGFAHAAAAQIPGATVDTSNPFAVYADAVKRAAAALDKEIAQATERFQIEAAELAQKRALDAATKQFTDSMQAAAKANDDWVFSLKPMTSPEITPWSSLVPKAIQVRPIGNQVGPPISVNMSVSGVWDSRSKAELKDVITETMGSARQWPTA